MTNTVKTVTETAATPCECSKYDALNSEQLTDENLASGSYDCYDTGCSETTRNTFAPGHDAKLKSFLIRHEAAGHEIRRHDGGVATSADAMGHAKRYAFAHMVEAGIRKAETKAQARADRAAANVAKKAERAGLVRNESEDAAAKADKLVVQAKVGRWTYFGVLLAAGDGTPVFRYTDKKGVEQDTMKFVQV